MTPVAAAPWGHEDKPELARWSAAVAIVIAAHVGLAATYMLLRPSQMLGSPEAPAVLLDLAPFPVAPVSNQDVAPGPRMQESLPPPEPEVLEPAPIETPVVAAPSAPVKPKPPVVKREERKPPAPRTTAPPRSEQAAPAIAAPRAGVAVLASEMANWRGLVAAHLRRYQQYPPGARARHEEGAVSMNFAVDRNGHVLSRHIVHGSGFADLDEEVLAMIERAQPLPAFPPSMTQSRADLTVPVRFSLR